MRLLCQRHFAALLLIEFLVGFRPETRAATNSPLVAIPPRALPANGPPIYYKDLSTLPPLPGAAAPTLPESPVTATNFPAAEGLGVSTPPDTHGAVGTNDVVTMLNYGVGFQTRTGLTNQTQDLHGFWNTTYPFDPRILYDPYHHRWIATVVDEQAFRDRGQLCTIDICVDG